jgi:hypothetical protein
MPEGHWKSRSAGYALAQHSSLPKASRDPLNVLFALERLAASMGVRVRFGRWFLEWVGIN